MDMPLVYYEKQVSFLFCKTLPGENGNSKYLFHFVDNQGGIIRIQLSEQNVPLEFFSKSALTKTRALQDILTQYEE